MMPGKGNEPSQSGSTQKGGVIHIVRQSGLRHGLFRYAGDHNPTEIKNTVLLTVARLDGKQIPRI